MTELAPDLAPPLSPPSAARSVPATWPSALAALRSRFPEGKDSVLFCIYKLEREPSLGLRDMRAEAASHGINLAGRSLHSARNLLGLAAAPAPKPAAPAKDPTRSAAKPRSGGRPRTPARAAAGDEPVETRLLSAVRQLQEGAAAESRRLREAMAAAIRTLQKALAQP